MTEKRRVRGGIIAAAVVVVVLLAVAGIVVYQRLRPVELMPDDEWFGTVLEYRTEHAADKEKLDAIVQALPLPRGLRPAGDYKLDTEDGVRLRLEFRCSGDPSVYVESFEHKTGMDLCGLTLMCLVGDIDHVSFSVTGAGEEQVALGYDRSSANSAVDADVWEESARPGQMKKLLGRKVDMNAVAEKDRRA